MDTLRTRGNLKEDLLQPVELVAYKPFPCLSRATAFADVFQYFGERATRLAETEDRLTRDAKASPIVALQGAPGCGKSFFLDELAKLQPSDIKVYAPAESLISEIISSSVAIPITYNTASPENPEADVSLERGLALRILYRSVN